MTASPALVIPAPAPVLLPVSGAAALFPVRRVYCVGRNYADHAREMGHDPDAEPPFFFQKNADNLVTDGRFPYPALSEDVHYEVELAVLLGAGGRDIARADAAATIYGYAVALDMTRRDLQAKAKKAGRPWEAAKAAEFSAPIGLVAPASAVAGIADAAISLSVNGAVKQSARISDMIWPIEDVIAHLSTLFILAPGDVILTGTPAGVGPVVRGDVMEASVEGLPGLVVTVV